MNLIEGEIVPGSANGSGPGYLFRREQWSLPLTDAWTPIFKRLGPVHAILGVRPSSLSLVPPSAPVEGPIHRATLSTLEGLLGETLVDLAITDILRFTAVVPDEGVPADGSTISFTIDPSGILLFDAHGGENLFTA